MKIISFFIFLLITTQLYSLDKTTYYSYGVEFDANYFKLEHTNKDSIKLYVNYRLLYDVLSFQEQVDSKDSKIFTSQVDIEIVLTDDGGIIRKRENRKDTIYAKSFEETNSKDLYHTGFFELNLKNSDFTISLVVIDRFKNKYQKELKLKKLDYNKILSTSDIMFYRSKAKSDYYDLSSYILSDAFLFDNNEVSMLICNDKSDKNFYYNVERLGKDDENSLFKYWSAERISYNNKAEALKNRDLKFELKNRNLIMNLPSGDIDFLKLSFPIEKNVPGSYKISIYSEDGQDTVTRYFDIIWESKPLSLDRISYAIDRMYYILTDEEYKTLSSGDKQLENFINYWKKLDPTPSTPYNEAMMQYFTRVDYAFFNFSTLGERDGAQTDRAKIFILYGPPSKILDKNIDNKKGIVWIYENLKKTFTFQVISSGFIKLIKIDE